MEAWKAIYWPRHSEKIMIILKAYIYLQGVGVIGGIPKISNLQVFHLIYHVANSKGQEVESLLLTRCNLIGFHFVFCFAFFNSVLKISKPNCIAIENEMLFISNLYDEIDCLICCINWSCSNRTSSMFHAVSSNQSNSCCR